MYDPIDQMSMDGLEDPSDRSIELRHAFGFTTPPVMQSSDLNAIAYGAGTLLVVWDWKVILTSLQLYFFMSIFSDK
jgi:hypothetical protein